MVCKNTSTLEAGLRFRFRLLPRERRRLDHARERADWPLFRNFDEHGNQLARPRTLLIDSEQLESGEALDDNFRWMAADEIERFRRKLSSAPATSRRRKKLPI